MRHLENEQEPVPAANTTDSPGRARRGAWIVLGITLLALALRVVCIAEMRDDLLFEHPRIDQADYVEWGRLIASGRYAENVPFSRPPGTPYALAAIFRIAGHGLLVPRLVQALLSALVCVVVYALGRAWFSRRVAIAAALVTAIHAVHIHAATELLPTTWLALLDALSLWTLVQAERRGGLGWFVASGLVLGLSALFLPTILLFVPVALAGLVWPGARRAAGAPARRRLVPAALLLAGLAAAVLPVTVRNTVRGGDFVLVASNDGINLWIGNNPDYARTFAIRPGREYQDLEWEPMAHGARRASEQSAYYIRKSLRWAATEPAQAVGLWLRKLYLFFHGAEIPRSSDIYLARPGSNVLRALVWPHPVHFPNALLMPLALLGLGVCWPERRRLLLPYGFLATQVLAVTVFFVCSRYRAPSLPVWTLFACAGAAWGWRSWGRAGWAPRAALGLALLAAVLLFDRPTHETTIDLRGEEAFYRGEAAFEERDYATAGRFFEQAIALDPRNNDAWDLLGHVRNRSGDPDGALAAWRRAAALDPLKTETARTIADALQKRGDVDGAIATLRASLAHIDDPRAYANDYSIDLVVLARLYLRRGDAQLALDAARSAVHFNPQNAAAARLRDEIAAGIAAPPGAGRR